MANETALMRQMQIAASELGARLFRQNAGQGWIGKSERISRAKTVALNPGDVIIRKARPFHAGHAGMSDLGGWMPVTIGHEHIGRTLAVYFQVEIKAGAKTTVDQVRWIDAVNRAGGIAGVVRSHDDLAALAASKSGSSD